MWAPATQHLVSALQATLHVALLPAVQTGQWAAALWWPAAIAVNNDMRVIFFFSVVSPQQSLACRRHADSCLLEPWHVLQLAWNGLKQELLSHKPGISVGCKSPRHGCDFTSKALHHGCDFTSTSWLTASFQGGRQWLAAHSQGSAPEQQRWGGAGQAAGSSSGDSRWRLHPAKAKAALRLRLQCHSSVHL